MACYTMGTVYIQYTFIIQVNWNLTPVSLALSLSHIHLPILSHIHSKQFIIAYFSYNAIVNTNFYLSSADSPPIRSRLENLQCVCGLAPLQNKTARIKTETKDIVVFIDRWIVRWKLPSRSEGHEMQEAKNKKNNFPRYQNGAGHRRRRKQTIFFPIKQQNLWQESFIQTKMKFYTLAFHAAVYSWHLLSPRVPILLSGNDAHPRNDSSCSTIQLYNQAD